MLIRMICGSFGATKDGDMTVKTNQSDPFEVDKKRALQLIASGYAVPVGKTEVGLEPDVDQDKASDDEPKPLSNCSIQELRKIAKDMGLSAGGTKAQIIERIESSFESSIAKEECEEDAEEDGDAPVLQPEDPV